MTDSCNSEDPLTPIIAQTVADRTKLNTAHRAVMLEDAAQTLKTQREATRAHLDKTVGLKEESEDVAIHIGDRHEHVHQAPPAAATPGSGQQLLRAGLLVAALLGTGGLGAGLVGLLGRSPALPAAPVPAPAPVAVEQPKQKYQVRWKFDGSKLTIEEVEPIP